MEGVQDILSRAGIFQGVDPVAVQHLIEQMETVRYPRGTTIFDEGEPGDRLYIITSGKIKLARHAPDGRENLLTVMGPSDMFGELSIFDPGPRTSSAVCVTEVQAATMNSELLKKWVGVTTPKSHSSCYASWHAACVAPTPTWPTSSSRMFPAAWQRLCCSWPIASASRKAAPCA